MAVRGISIQAYREHKASGAALKQWHRIYNTVRFFSIGDGITRAELEQKTGIRLSSVCGRVNELMNAKPVGLIREGNQRVCRVTKHLAHPLIINKAALANDHE